jgi:hypothetical protein
MRFDRDKFFDGYRTAFGKLNQSQVDGLEFLLSKIETERTLTEASYLLATVKHETADTFKPITEYGGVKYFSKYDVGKLARQLGNTPERDGDGFKYRGRGYSQLTGLSNYKRYGIENDPEKALEPNTAIHILLDGTARGVFTGKKLGTYITTSKTDYKNARRVINGTDDAALIADYARKFELILRASNSATATASIESDANRTTNVQPPETTDTAANTPLPITDAVAVEGESLPTDGFFKRKWKEVTVAIGGLTGITTLKQNADSLGLPVEIITYLLAGAGGIFILWLVGSWLNEKVVRPIRARWLTTSLITANTTPTNTIIVAAPDQLYDLEKMGYTIATRK